MFKKLKLNVFGESHGAGIGAVCDNFPHGEKVDIAELKQFLERRKPKNLECSTPRIESDEINFLSGIYNGQTTGAPIGITIANNNANSASYAAFGNTPRPSHADYGAYVKYGGCQDMRGGGHFSGRLTTPICAIGGMAKQILARKGILVGSYVRSIGDITDIGYMDRDISYTEISQTYNLAIPSLTQPKALEMLALVKSVRDGGDSVGGTIETIVYNLPVGLGGTLFDSLESQLAAVYMAIPAVKGVEFGIGYGFSKLKGSQANDQYFYDGSIKTTSNNNGGILGGITNGQNLNTRIVIKPTPSISLPQNTVNLSTKENVQISIKGRHDACIVPRAVVVAEAVTALVILDNII